MPKGERELDYDQLLKYFI